MLPMHSTILNSRLETIEFVIKWGSFRHTMFIKCLVKAFYVVYLQLLLIVMTFSSTERREKVYMGHNYLESSLHLKSLTDLTLRLKTINILKMAETSKDKITFSTSFMQFSQE